MTAGNIYDLGYRPYDGERLGRRKAFEALYVNSVRGIFGLGRSTMNKVFPMALAGMASLPATVALAVAALAPTPVELFRPENYFFYTKIILALFCAVASVATSATARSRSISRAPSPASTM
jgi:ABC-2 type transport system permease protein